MISTMATKIVGKFWLTAAHNVTTYTESEYSVPLSWCFQLMPCIMVITIGAYLISSFDHRNWQLNSVCLCSSKLNFSRYKILHGITQQTVVVWDNCFMALVFRFQCDFDYPVRVKIDGDILCQKWLTSAFWGCFWQLCHFGTIWLDLEKMA